MSLATIHLRRAMNRAGHIQDRAQDRTAVVVAHTRAAAVVDLNRTVAVDRHLMAAEDHRPTAAGATANHIRARAPVPITGREAARTLLLKIC